MSQQYGNYAITDPVIIQNSVGNYSRGKYARNGLWPPAAPALLHNRDVSAAGGNGDFNCRQVCVYLLQQ